MHFTCQQELTLQLMPELLLSCWNYIKKNLFNFIDYLVKKWQTKFLEIYLIHWFIFNVYLINNYNFINTNYCYLYLLYFIYFLFVIKKFLGIIHFQFFNIFHSKDFLNQNPFEFMFISNFIVMIFGY
jgi:hypothetical protein